MFLQLDALLQVLPQKDFAPESPWKEMPAQSLMLLTHSLSPNEAAPLPECPKSPCVHGQSLG